MKEDYAMMKIFHKRTPKKKYYWLLVGISIFLNSGGSALGQEFPTNTEKRESMPKQMDQDLSTPGLSDDQRSTGLPPVNDSEMVIDPNVPVDSDAVISPPPLDPEMAVDPVTGKPMTKEDLENLERTNELNRKFPELGDPNHQGDK